MAVAAGSGAGRSARAKHPKVRQRVLDVLSREEINHLEAAAGHERDKPLIRVLADTGIRLGGALGLRDRDLRVVGRRQHFLSVGGKTGERMAPISPALHDRLRRWIQHGRPKDYSGDRIFISLRRTHANGRHHGEYKVPDRWAISHMVKEAGERAGIQKRVYPHLLRHSAITHLLRRGVNPILTAQLAGHSSLEMIRSTYSHLTRTDAHTAMMAALRAEAEDE